MEKGDKEEIRALFSFDKNDPEEEVLLRFDLWSRFFFPQYFKAKDADFHKDIDRFNYRVYRGVLRSFVNIAFRGAAKTTRTKLFVAFCILNDMDHYRKYVKILTKDITNSKQFVTDIYNMFVIPSVAFYYHETFQKKVDKEKREETMAAFTTATGVKVIAGTVGTDQRGQLQEESRPDFIIFDDFETRKTLRSAVETMAIRDNMEEAKNGLAKGGGAIYLCNYISERGNVHQLVTKKSESKEVLIVPIKFNGKPMWDAFTIEEINQIEKDADDFTGEYMCEPSAGADVFFDRECLMTHPVRKPIKEVGGFKMFYNYDPSHRYASGHDVSGGVGLDSSTSAFIDFSTTPSRVVATFKSNTIKPDTFGDEIAREANIYGACLVAPETNNHGHATIGRLKQIFENIYFTEQKETRVGMPPRVRNYGWHTNADTKPKMLFALKKAVEDGQLLLSDEDIIAELRDYTRDDLMDKEEDVRLTTRHFDLLIATAIAYQMKDHAVVKSEIATGFKQAAYEPPTLD